MANEEEKILVVELVDENGESAEFEHLMTLEYEGSNYIVLYPLEEVEGVNEDEVMIMRVESDGEEDTYYPVEDTATLEEVFSIFMESFEDEEDDEDEEAEVESGPAKNDNEFE
ncbi:MAG: DUF1292 domain-containing protein [Bacillota bacterium]